MKSDRHALKAVRDVTENDAPTVHLAAIGPPVTALPMIARPVMAKAEVRAMAKGDLQEVVNRIVVVNRDAAKGLRAVRMVAQWDHQIQNASWRMRCVLMPTRMVSSAKKN